MLCVVVLFQRFHQFKNFFCIRSFHPYGILRNFVYLGFFDRNVLVFDRFFYRFESFG